MCPDGIHMYFDNVGGELTSTVMNIMNDFGRIAVCGIISGYNTKTPIQIIQLPILTKHLKIEGFMGWTYTARWPEGIEKFIKYITEGKMTYKEHVTEGFDNMFKAFYELFTGANFGKAIVKV
ncbi:putative NADP-dependent oxidoreductase YfmJ [Anneissia japonica]|uniref:putative NADP-dependent oxidoreductase YfmJ n=1 Tax=Anneissia japonica TaxID=1529436 RepID=UPI0014257CCF|nr:putative NADP-dependent oxidoreductase YfmJ [Anneissia japonica]